MHTNVRLTSLEMNSDWKSIIENPVGSLSEAKFPNALSRTTILKSSLSLKVDYWLKNNVTLACMSAFNHFFIQTNLCLCYVEVLASACGEFIIQSDLWGS